jgi:branched-chain amino acid transport system substrate-binding protein
MFELLKGLQDGEVRGVSKVPVEEIDTIASACEKTEWGSNVAGMIRFWAKQYGFKMKKALLYAKESPDFSDEVRSLKADRPGVMLFASNTSDAILIVKTLKAQNAKPRMIWGQGAGFENTDFRDALGDGIVGILTRTVYHPKVADIKPVTGQVNMLYKAKTGNNFGGASVRAFTAIQTWVHVFEMAGSDKPVDIQQTANTIHISGDELVVPWSGIKFSTSGDEIGQNIFGNGLIAQYQKGANGAIIMEIVYPFEVASADMVYPYPQF